MQIQFFSKNIELTDALKTFTTEKLDHLFKRFSRITSAHVTFEVTHHTQIVEATLHIDGMELHAGADHQDMYCAIDSLIDKLNTLLTKHKEKLIDNHR